MALTVEHVELARTAWATGDIERVRESISLDLPNALGVFGTAEQCRARIEEYWNAGIGTLGIVAPNEDPYPTLDAFVSQRREA